MNQAITIEVLLDNMRKDAEELAARLHDIDRQHAEKFGKQAAWLSKLHTCWRIHGVLPTARPKPTIVEAAQNVHQLHQGLKRLQRQIDGK